MTQEDEYFDIYEEYGKERIRGDQLFGIAADLLKELEVAVTWIEDDSEYRPTRDQILPQLRAAIAKAKADA